MHGEKSDFSLLKLKLYKKKKKKSLFVHYTLFVLKFAMKLCTFPILQDTKQSQNHEPAKAASPVKLGIQQRRHYRTHEDTVESSSSSSSSSEDEAPPQSECPLYSGQT